MRFARPRSQDCRWPAVRETSPIGDVVMEHSTSGQVSSGLQADLLGDGMLVFATTLSVSVFAPALRPLCDALFHDAPRLAHTAMAAHVLGGAIGGPLFGYLADRSGARRAITSALCVADAIALVLILGAGSSLGGTESFIALRFFQGAFSVGALSILMARATSQVHRGAAFKGAALVVAIAAGMPLGAVLMAVGDAKLCLTVSLILQASVAALVLLTSGDSAQAPTRATPQALELTDKRAALLGLSWTAAERFGVGAFVVTFSIWAHRVLGRSDAEVAALMSWFVVPFAVSMFVVARFAAKFDPRVLGLMGLVGYAAAFAALPFSASMLKPVLLACGLASTCIYGPSLCLMSRALPSDRRASGMGWINGAGNLGMLAGTITAGLLAATSEPAHTAERVFLVVSAVLLLVALVSIFVSRKGK